MYTRSPPFKSLGNDMQILMAVSQGRRPERSNEPTYLEDGYWTLITRCWEADPRDRPSIREAREQVGSCLNGYYEHPRIDCSDILVGINNGTASQIKHY
jgi:hypothetical protein